MRRTIITFVLLLSACVEMGARPQATATFNVQFTWNGATQAEADAERRRDLIFFLLHAKPTYFVGEGEARRAKEFLLQDAAGNYVLDAQGRPQLDPALTQAQALNAIRDKVRDYFTSTADAGEVAFEAEKARAAATTNRKNRPKP